jgi:uncharacterized protein involved in exopolysaccharide biosynthesis
MTAIATLLVRHRLLIAVPALLLALGTLGLVAVRPRSFTSVASFTAESRRTSPATPAGLAAQFGIALASPEATRSPQFYVDFVRSHWVLGALADSRFPMSAGDSTALAQLLRIERGDAALTREAVIDDLSRRIASSANVRTGVVRLSARMPTRDAARAVNERLLALLNDFNLRTRQSQASAERAFTGSRLAEATQELRASEDQALAFLQSNRDYERSPQLSFRADRLRREVALRQQVVTMLSASYEEARIDEVRDTPAITVIEPAEAPVRPDPRGILPKLLLALVAGATIGTVAVLVIETLRSMMHSDEPWAESLRSELRAMRILRRS